MRSLRLSIIIFAIAFASCKKSESVSVYPGILRTPPAPNMAGYWTTQDFLDMPNVWGILESIKIRGNYGTLTGQHIPIYANIASARFAYGQAGKVSLNDIQLDTTAGYAYNTAYVNASPYVSDSLRLSSNDKWKVSGYGKIPGFTHDYTSDFPSFYGKLPDTIDGAHTFSITFDAGNCSGADSAFVVVTGDHSYLTISTAVSTNGGTITFPPGSLYYVPDDQYLEVFLYRYTIKELGKKRFAFAKTYQFIQNVIIK